MKRIVFFLLTLTMIWSAQAAPISAKMKHATVFLNGAELTQVATLNLQKGDNDIVIDNLSPVLNQQTLQIKLPVGMIISQYDYSIDYLAADKVVNSVQLLKDSLKVAEKELNTIENELKTTEQMLELLQKGVTHSMQVENQAINTETIEKNLAYYNTRAIDLKTKTYALTAKQKEQKDLIARLQKQIKSSQKPTGRRSGLLTLKVNSPKTTTAKAEITYFTSRANWTPSYEINVTEVGKPMNLTMKVAVAQTTGLDWQDVNLTLSTGAPSQNNIAPTMSRWTVREQPQQQQVRIRGVGAVTNTMAMKSSYDMVVAEAPMMEEDADEIVELSTVSQYVAVNDKAVAVEYDIDLPYTILGNGKEQTIALLQKQINNVDYTYYTVPRLDKGAYLLANINDWEKLQLLDGTATITYNGTFYGQTYLSSNTTNEQLRLTLAKDPQVVIKRERVEEYTATKLVGQEKRVTVGYKTTIRNTKQQAIDLVLKEQYPLTTDKNIKIELLADKTTSYSAHDTDNGFLTYNLTLQPGETKEVIMTYQVKYPASMKVTDFEH